MSFDQKHIEDYVLGRLSDEERAAFQFAMMRDKNLRGEVEAMRVLQKMARAKKAKRRSLLFFSPKTLLRVAAVFIGLATLAVLIALYNNREKELPIVNENKNEPTEQKEDFKEQQIVEEEEIKNPQPELKDSTERSVVERPPSNKAPLPQQKEKPAPEKEMPKRYSNEDELPINNQPDSIPEEYVETPPDSGQLEPIFFLNPEVLSNVQETPDTSQFSENEKGPNFELQFMSIASPHTYGDYFVNANGDTIMVDVDSIFALEEYEKELASAKEMAYYPKKITFTFSPEFPNYSYPDYSYFYYAPAEVKENDPRYQPNPTLEKWMEKGNQNDSLEIAFEPHAKPFSLDEKGELNIKFSCHIYGKFNDKPMLKTYSNHAEDFIQRNPLFQTDILYNSSQDVGGKSYHLKTDLPNGLYYAVFENENSGEILAVKKFNVVDQYPFEYDLQTNYSKRKRKQFKKFFQKLFKKKFPKNNPHPDYAFNPTLKELYYLHSKKEGLELTTYTKGKFTPWSGDRTAANLSITAKCPSTPYLYLFVYSNKPGQYEAQFPMVYAPLQDHFESVETGKYYVETSIVGNFRPGLYYFVITDRDFNGEVLAVDRFTVGN